MLGCVPCAQGHRREGDGLGDAVNTKDRDRVKERERLKEREKMKLDALRKEKDKAMREKSSKSSEGKDAEAAKKRKMEKTSPTDGGSKGSLDYRVVALTVRKCHSRNLFFLFLPQNQRHPGARLSTNTRNLFPFLSFFRSLT